MPIYSLSQYGTIPVDANHILFYADGSPWIDFRVNNKTISYSTSIITSIADADVSAYAGQQVELIFIFPKGANIQFDIAGFTSVPEPSTYALFGLGAALLWYHRRHRPR